MPEFAFIAQLKDEPLAVVVLGAMVIYKIIELLIKHLLPLITHKKKKPIEEILAGDAEERKERQTALDEKLGEIETSIEKLFSIVTDQEAIITKASQGTLENMLFNDSQSMFKRMKAFLRLIAMRKNGRIREYGFNLILHNKEAWRDVLEANIDLKIVDQNYFDEVKKDIEDRIFRF